MIDIHHHLLYGVDDGAPGLAASLALARTAAAEGVTHIVCTPHYSDLFPWQQALIAERLAELRAQLDGAVALSLGCDFHLTAENIAEALAHPPRYSIANKGYLLVEFPRLIVPPQLDDALYRLQTAGYTIVVTHPERYPAILSQPELLAGWLRRGCLVQLTAGSLCGRFGAAVEAFSQELLRRHWVHFVASDAHHPRRRPPQMKEAHAYVAKRMGEETARRLFLTNPQAALAGNRLPAQPQPLGLDSYAPLNFDLSKFPLVKRAVAADSRLHADASRFHRLCNLLFSRRIVSRLNG